MALRDKGYDVVEASSAAEALALVTASPAPIDAMISDLIMPGMDGLKLARIMREKHSLDRILPDVGLFLSRGLNAGSGDVPRENILQKPDEPGQDAGALKGALGFAGPLSAVNSLR